MNPFRDDTVVRLFGCSTYVSMVFNVITTYFLVTV